ncbi:hypothetical protein [Streptomyces sp. NPDC005336]|uniref:hypothetical protein n=1 Tax=unclassified Streptomyces TaxID=2593676 RepID=UPI0033A13885
MAVLLARYRGIRADWPFTPDGKRRVIREWEEVPRRVADGSFREADLVGGAWRC